MFFCLSALSDFAVLRTEEKNSVIFFLIKKKRFREILMHSYVLAKSFLFCYFLLRYI